jgi:uncharacterized protein YdeI (YjbR/CyaY-like superfamily)
LGEEVSKKMMDEFFAANRNEWRAWLQANHDAVKGVWLVYYKKRVGRPSVSYDESVEEAICFGWIDSVIRRLDDERCVRKFMPRRADSNWSESNKKRAQKMIEEGKMTEVGFVRVNEAKESGEWYTVPEVRKDLEIPEFFLQALGKSKKALLNFEKLANSYKRQYVGWVTNAKKEETRKRRLAEVISVLEQDRKLGLK